MLYLLLFEKKKEIKERNVQGAFFQGRHALLAMPCQDFLGY
jgi:hypothetical protein